MRRSKPQKLRLQVGRQAWYLRVEERQAEKGRAIITGQEKSTGPMSQNRFHPRTLIINDALNSFQAGVSILETNSTKPSNT